MIWVCVFKKNQRRNLLKPIVGNWWRVAAGEMESHHTQELIKHLKNKYKFNNKHYGQAVY